MKTNIIFLRAALCALLPLIFSQFSPVSAVPIESGQYLTSAMSTNNPATPFSFYAEPGDMVLIRLANEEEIGNPQNVPDCRLYDPNGVLVQELLGQYTMVDMEVSITTLGWYTLWASLPPILANYEEDVAYSISILRMPNAPLSYADLDVGPLRSGEALTGIIDVGADLDAGTVAISEPTRLQIRMGQSAPSLVPQIRLYDPDGLFVTNAYPPEYRAEITTDVLTKTGIYTVVCNDYFKGVGPYVLSMVKIPGVLEGDDDDIGLIINGETKYGTIDKSGDLDVAWFFAVPDDVVSLRMQAETPALNPVMELYGPDMQLIARAVDLMQQTVSITNLTIIESGQYTVICKDMEDRHNVTYSLSLDFLSGPSTESLPAVPAGLTATKGTYTNYIQINWNSAEGALGYDIWRSHGTVEPVLIVTNHSKMTYADYDVVTNIHYFYKVKSRNSYGVSTNFSNTDSGWCGITTIPVSDVRKAIVVGIDNYSPGYQNPLNGCVNDAHGIRDIMLLGDPSNRWGRADIQVFTDRQATKNTLRGALNNLAESSGAGDLVLYTHSGHGGQTDPNVNPSNVFVCAYDQNYYDHELGDDLARFRPDTRVVLIFDTCHSGGMFKDPHARPPMELFVERAMARYRQTKTAQLRARGQPVPKDLGANIAFMTSSDYDELSWEIGGQGLYTGYLLQGCALTDIDVNMDGNYSFKELHDYAAAKTVETKPTQNAQFHNGTLLSNTIARAVGVVTPVFGGVIYNDYDGDGKSDLVLYNEATGVWRAWLSSLGYEANEVTAVFGGPGYRPIAGDYNGDGFADLALYNEALGTWNIASPRTQRMLVNNAGFGGPGMRPVAGDYTGDGRFDGALYARYDNGYWYVVTASGAVITWGSTWTGPGYTAVSGDYNGDHRSDYALYHDDTGYWFIRSVLGDEIAWGVHFGQADWTPVSGDYDGDGVSDLAVYHQATGLWYIKSLQTDALIVEGVRWGGPGFVPVPGDYTGNGVYDLAVYNQALGLWLIRTVSGDRSATVNFGGPGYVPVLPTLW